MVRRFCLFALLAAAASGQPGIDYLVITPARLVPAFAEFAAWKTRRGVRTEVVAVETVLAHTPGRDRAEKTRNFIKVFHDSLGTEWVLLGGDTAGVPTRMAWPQADPVPCDLYFSDLDGTWDLDNDGRFGEVHDSVDLYSDAFVGRAPVTDTAQAAAASAKWIEFEQGANPGYLLKLLKAGDTTPLGAPPGWFEVTLPRPPRRYEFCDSLNSGFQFVFHRGHGDETHLAVDTNTILTIGDIPQLANSGRENVLATVACFAGAFQRTCIGTELLRASDRGSVAVVAHSDVVYTVPGDYLARQFFAGFFSTDTLYEVGKCLGRSKDHYVPVARTNVIYRQALYTWNLVGEPGLTCWKHEPEELDVAHPALLDTGPQFFPVEVTAGGGPAEALVCLWKGSEVYERRQVTGLDSILIHPATPGEMLVTATAYDHAPYCGSCGIATYVVEQRAGSPDRFRVRVSHAGILVDASVPALIDVLDVVGRRVLCLRLDRPSAGPLILDVSRLAPGVYFLHSTLDNRHSKIARFVLSR